MSNLFSSCRRKWRAFAISSTFASPFAFDFASIFAFASPSPFAFTSPFASPSPFAFALTFSLPLLFLSSCTSTTPVFHASHEPRKANAPYSDAVQVGKMYFLSGQIGMDNETRTLVAGGIEAETTQTLENIKAVLAQHGMTMSNVVKAMVVLDDIEDFAAFNAIYRTYLPQKPARTTFAAEALAAGAKIEIEVVAVK